MEVLSIRPAIERERCLSRVVARFDIRISPEITVRNMSLKRRADGSFRSFPPNAQGAQVMHFAPDLAKEITDAAAAAFNGERMPHDHS